MSEAMKILDDKIKEREEIRKSDREITKEIMQIRGSLPDKSVSKQLEKMRVDFMRAKRDRNRYKYILAHKLWEQGYSRKDITAVCDLNVTESWGKGGKMRSHVENFYSGRRDEIYHPPPLLESFKDLYETGRPGRKFRIRNQDNEHKRST